MRRFAVVGVLATAIDIGVAVALLRRGWSLPTADLVALATAAVFAHPLHRAITLRDDPFTRWMRSPGAFAAVVTTAGLVDMLVLSWVRIDGTLTDDILSKATAVAAAAIVRAVAYRTLLFRVVRREQEHPVRRPLPEGTHRLTVVLPAYREADRIGDTVTRVRTELGERLGDTLEALQIVVVDDGSDDDTSGAAAAAGADTVVRLEVNSGKGAAVRAGVAAATGSTIAFTDADLAYSPAQIADLMTLVEDGYDMVVGSRRHTDTRTLVAAGRIREAGGRLVNLATHALLLGQYHDTQCGLKAFRADAARALFDASRLDGFAFDVELFHLAERWRLPLAEVPVEVEYSDRSTVSVLSDGLRLVADLIRVRQAARRGDYPNPTQLGAHTDG
ncbi:MAG: glycosyltransferase [Acidimicrobiales bacterium]|jgi:putative flippase GtrA|nr:glycosyltransferase [Actinomycetes bacterium]MEE1522762.1 glycosyltransferase [Acidimicrobiales bacterium]